MSKYGVISGPYFPVLGLNTGKHGPEITPYFDTFQAVIKLSTHKMNDFNIFIMFYFRIYLCRLSLLIFSCLFIFVLVISIDLHLFYLKHEKWRTSNYVKQSILDVFGTAIYYPIIIIYRGS